MCTRAAPGFGQLQAAAGSPPVPSTGSAQDQMSLSSPHRRCVPPAADLEGAGGNTPLHFLPTHSSRPSSPAAPSCSTLRSSVPSSAASELLPQQPAGSFFTAVNLACHHTCPPAARRVLLHSGDPGLPPYVSTGDQPGPALFSRPAGWFAAAARSVFIQLHGALRELMICKGKFTTDHLFH